MPFKDLTSLAQSHLASGKKIVLFDGVCFLCNSSVNFILKNDPDEHFLFVYLQSELAQELIASYPAKTISLHSIILLSKSEMLTQSTAILEICKRLKWPMPFFCILLIVPAFIRNFFYRLVARNRYSWFGESVTCILPNEKMKERLLND